MPDLEDRIDALLAEGDTAAEHDAHEARFGWLAAGVGQRDGDPAIRAGLGETTEDYDGPYSRAYRVSDAADEAPGFGEAADDYVRPGVRYAPGGILPPPHVDTGGPMRDDLLAVAPLLSTLDFAASPLLAALDQDVEWRPRTGPPIALEAMGPRHRRNTLAWLRARANGLWRRHIAVFMFAPADVFAEAFRESTVRSPAQWLEEQPLIRRLVALVAADEAAGTPDEPPPTAAQLADWRAANNIPEPPEEGE